MSSARGMLASVRLLIGLMRLTFRFVSGRPMSGDRKTDSTFWRPATRSLDPSGRALRWEMMRGASRLAWRMVAVWWLALLAALLVMRMLSLMSIHAPWYLRVGPVLSLNVLLFGAPLSYWLARRFIVEHGLTLVYPARGETETGHHWEVRSREITTGRRSWEREVVMPLGRMLAPHVQQSHNEREIRSWLTVPRDFRSEHGHPVEVRLPHGYAGLEKARETIVRLAGERLGLREPLASWQLEGSSPRLLISAPTLPPEKVLFSHVRDYFESAEQFRPFMGLTGVGKAAYAEMILDSPHVGVGAGPGAGKSSFAKNFIMQALHWGWGVVILDWKMTEAYKWAIGLPGVTYVTRIDAIHDMGVRIGQEVDLRKEAGMTGRANVLVVRDEWNATAELLMAYWQDLRGTADPEEKKTMPLRSPALRGFATLDFAGREFGMFDFLIAQRFSGRVFNGNTDIRECFGIRCLARYSHQTKQMLVGSMKPFPRKSNLPGRWTIVAGDDVAVVQAPWTTNEEAREFALSGKPNPVTPFSSSYYPELSDDGAANVTGSNTQEDRLPEGVTAGNGSSPVLDYVVESDTAVPRTQKLRELAETFEYLGLTYKIIQHARDNDRTFPPAYGGNQFSGYTYDVEKVKEWARARHASQHAAREIKG